MNWPKLTLSDDYLVWMQRIRATPDDDLPRLIFADWLEEKGDTIYCHFIRQSIVGNLCGKCGGKGKVSLGYCNAFMYSCEELGIECEHKKKLITCGECRGTGLYSSPIDKNAKPTTRQVQEGFVRREVIEQVFPLLSGSYKLSRGFISEVSIAPNDYLKWDGEHYLWELLRITQPLFTVVVETNWDRLLNLSAGRYPPHSFYLSLIDGTVIENRIKSGNVSPISKWCVR